MSVVAGAVMFDGVVLTADCRSTYKIGGKAIHVDNVQKLLPLTPYVSVGFVGNIVIAGAILASAIRQLQKFPDERRLHPDGIIRWLPRFARHRFGRVRHRLPSPHVAFMLGAVIPGRSNVVRRSRVVDILERFRKQELSHQRSFLPGIVMQVMQTPSHLTHIVLPGRPASLLVIMESPSFTPKYVHTLGFAALGSGAGAEYQINREADWIFAGDVGNSFIEGVALANAVQTWVEQNAIPDVGGMFPRLKLNAEGTFPMGIRTEIPFGGTKIELVPGSNGRWVQRNITTGKEIRLSLPWELRATNHIEPKTFDDYRDAIRLFRGE